MGTPTVNAPHSCLWFHLLGSGVGSLDSLAQLPPTNLQHISGCPNYNHHARCCPRDLDLGRALSGRFPLIITMVKLVSLIAICCWATSPISVKAMFSLLGICEEGNFEVGIRFLPHWISYPNLNTSKWIYLGYHEKCQRGFN